MIFFYISFYSNSKKQNKCEWLATNTQIGVSVTKKAGSDSQVCFGKRECVSYASQLLQVTPTEALTKQSLLHNHPSLVGQREGQSQTPWALQVDFTVAGLSHPDYT